MEIKWGRNVKILYLIYNSNSCFFEKNKPLTDLIRKMERNTKNGRKMEQNRKFNTWQWVK